MAKTTSKKTAMGIKLGSCVKDNITGFTGIVIGRTEFAFGCIHISIQAPGLTPQFDVSPRPTCRFGRIFDRRDDLFEFSTTVRKPIRRPHPAKLPAIIHQDVVAQAIAIAS